MRKSFFAAAFVLMLPATGLGGPCLPGTLQDYINLGAVGCEVDGGTTRFDFSSGTSFPGEEEIPAAQIQVIVTDPGSVLTIDFVSTQLSAGPGELLGVLIGYTVTGCHMSEAVLR
jgi:hypothetical protein